MSDEEIEAKLIAEYEAFVAKSATECRGEFTLTVRADDKTLARIGRAFEKALKEAAR